MTFRKVIKRVTGVGFVVCMLMCLTGCDEQVAVQPDRVKAMVQTRSAFNQDCLTQLYDSGLMDQESYEKYSKAIDSSLKTIEEAFDVDMTDADAVKKKLKQLTCVYAAYYTAGYSRAHSGPCSDGGYYVGDELKDAIKPMGDDCVALDLLGTGGKSGAEELQDLLNYNIWVIDPAQVQNLNNANGGDGLKALNSIITQAQASNDYSQVKQYFTDSGYKLLGDSIDPYGPNGLLCKTTAVSFSNEYADGCNVMGKNLVIPTDDGFQGNHTSYIDESGNRVITCKCLGDNPSNSADKCWFAQLQLIEFNKATVQALTGAGAAAQNRYIVVKDGSATPYILLMEYPVDTVRNLTYDSSDGSWEIGLGGSSAASSYTYNILTGAVRCKTSTGADTSSIDWGSTNEVLIDSKSFKLSTAEPDKIYMANMGFQTGSSSSTLVGACHMLLTDYLELTYMPDVVEGENLIALGRRVRITKLSGNSVSDTVGIYIDKSGDPIVPTGTATGSGSLTQIEIPASALIDVEYAKATKIVTLGDTANPSTNVAVTGSSGTALLDHDVADEIEVTARFWKNMMVGTHPSVNQLDSVISSSNSSGDSDVVPPPLYGIAVDLDPFTTSLYSGWIATSDTGAGSLDWWQAWLQSAKFKYTIDKTALEQALMGSYSSELRKNGIIILDLDTISKIQDEYTTQDQVSRVTMFRTIFALMGILLGGYGILLMAAWAIDVNTVGGPKFLTLLTFGHWIAISSDEDIPGASQDGLYYTGFGQVFKGAILMIALGAVLSVIDVVGIVNWMIQAFGRLAEYISSTLLG